MRRSPRKPAAIGSSIGYTAPDQRFLRALLTELSCWVEAIASTDGGDCELGSSVTASLPVLSEIATLVRIGRERQRSHEPPSAFRVVDKRRGFACRLCSGTRRELLSADD